MTRSRAAAIRWAVWTPLVQTPETRADPPDQTALRVAADSISLRRNERAFFAGWHGNDQLVAYFDTGGPGPVVVLNLLDGSLHVRSGGCGAGVTDADHHVGSARLRRELIEVQGAPHALSITHPEVVIEAIEKIVGLVQ